MSISELKGVGGSRSCNLSTQGASICLQEGCAVYSLGALYWGDEPGNMRDVCRFGRMAMAREETQAATAAAAFAPTPRTCASHNPPRGTFHCAPLLGPGRSGHARADEAGHGDRNVLKSERRYLGADLLGRATATPRLAARFRPRGGWRGAPPLGCGCSRGDCALGSFLPHDPSLLHNCRTGAWDPAAGGVCGSPEQES